MNPEANPLTRTGGSPTRRSASSPGAPVWLRIATFALVYGALQSVYQISRSAAIGRTLIENVVAAPAGALTNAILPGDAVIALGPSLVWAGGSLTLLAGCDGFELSLLFVSAMLVADVSVLRGTVAIVVGCCVTWALNLGRIVALYVAARRFPESFDIIHTIWGPAVLIAAVVMVYLIAVDGGPRRSSGRSPTTSCPEP